MTDKKKKPWFKFFPTDWMADPKLRSCSDKARAMWIDLICLMHQSEEYGYLLVGDTPPTTAELSRLTQRHYHAVVSGVNELVNRGVCSIDTRGVIYSRKMVRDYAKSLKGKEDGKKGGNPGLTQGLTRVVNPHIPESIFHIPEKKEEKKEAAAEVALTPAATSSFTPTPVPRAPSPYAFERGHMAITHEQMAEWQTLYGVNVNVKGEVKAYLSSCDPNKSDWFGHLSRKLAYLDREMRKTKETPRAVGEAKPVKTWLD